MIEHQYVFKCDECVKKHTIDLSDNRALVRLAEREHLPPGWSLVRGRLICDEHQVIVKDEDNS